MTGAEDTRRPIEARLFSWLDGATAKVRAGTWLDTMFKPFWSGQARDLRDWESSARYAIDRQQIVRARGILYGVVAIFAILLVWSAFATVDEVTRGEGKVIPSQQLQIVQSVDGGVVEEIFVQEGQKVEKGQMLVRIDPTRFAATLGEEKARAFALRAKIERLNALVNGTAYEPEEPAGEGQAGASAALILAQERQYFYQSRQQLNERLLMARQQVAQRQSELGEVEAALRSAERSYRMAQEELAITRPLLNSGAVSEMEVLRLERDVSRAQGDRQQAQARRAQLAGSIQEAQTRIRDVELTTKNEWRAELTAAMAELNSLGENVTGLADRVKYSRIRSPVDGVVQRVLYNTIGGVVQPGHAVVEVVPTGGRLVVEAKVSPRDIAFLRPGLPAVVKFTAYDFSVYGGMPAKLVHISPDSITDDKGNTYYLVKAETTSNQFREGLPVIPGMTVQLDVLTGEKTVLSYLLKPILRAKANALSER
ncbi:HlyD family type I secretion periplasmic adaptor subunit [Pelagerythrobacter rhizovicinus]|uniref:Membrane fusion protein (MFP) family protein n=1 Tax=Pelagerythrobacter rhizovicinus TaxID=2268576 RepID=A0A4Q2KPG7_9SPHN|nr:HlyD family type I secretion periplasmic adaptor subunit [Pelagerythrobacter rhizovicinus]RXZ65502.1 HlyD family type I secretion periplasmic adaptor subunit [Pelagerythrobacter rhizovicinus]